MIPPDEYADLRGDDVLTTFIHQSDVIMDRIVRTISGNAAIGKAAYENVSMPSTKPDYVLYKFKIVCGCGFYTTDTLDDWDAHLAELVANDDGNIKLHVDRTTVQLVEIAEERATWPVDAPVPYTTQESERNEYK